MVSKDSAYSKVSGKWKGLTGFNRQMQRQNMNSLENTAFRDNKNKLKYV
jgi:hypothetical protein